ncbi:MAG: hypothetical protein ABSA70_16060 [Terriglobia bacterium]
MRTIDVGKITNSDMLIGSGRGRSDFPRFVEAAFVALEPETILWDWSNVRVATASYFAAAFVPVMRMLSAAELEKYFVLFGLNENCKDELEFVLETEGLAVFFAENMRDGRILSARPIGKLDSVHAQTLDRVIRRSGISAKRLYADSAGGKKAKVGKTAWINRLVALHKLRLITRKRVGKEYIYAVPYLEV